MLFDGRVKMLSHWPKHMCSQLLVGCFLLVKVKYQSGMYSILLSIHANSGV